MAKRRKLFAIFGSNISANVVRLRVKLSIASTMNADSYVSLVGRSKRLVWLCHISTQPQLSWALARFPPHTGWVHIRAKSFFRQVVGHSVQNDALTPASWCAIPRSCPRPRNLMPFSSSSSISGCMLILNSITRKLLVDDDDVGDGTAQVQPLSTRLHRVPQLRPSRFLPSCRWVVVLQNKKWTLSLLLCAWVSALGAWQM